MIDSVIDKGTFRMDWKTGKMVRCQDRPELPKGTIVWAEGPGCLPYKFAMTGEGSQCVMLEEPHEGCYFGPFTNLDKYALPYSEKFGIGLYYDLTETPATDEEIQAAIERGHAFEAEQKAKKEAEAQAFAEAIEDAREKFGSLYEEKPQGFPDAAFVAKNIRRGLANRFPGQKFSVRKADYSTIYVSWTDGPTEDEVDEIVGLFREDCELDRWNDDIWNYSDSAFTTVFGGVRYLRLDRELSDAVTDPIVAEIVADCPALADGQEIHRDKFFYTEGANAIFSRLDETGSFWWFSAIGIARAILSKKSFYEAPANKKAKASDDANKVAKKDGNGLSYVDYSEKAFAVTGDTRPVADKLKDLGGRFNARLSCGPGWIFSKKKEAEVRAALSL